ncbi:MAG: hypothetical protein GF400_10920 [Candidatus Eisenbacteria bacterium]|nr:hypothetical protein [Candidatus Eisenbacteria bacterium]
MSRSGCLAFRTVALVTAVALFAMVFPVASLAQEEETPIPAGDACVAGTRDGQNVDTGMWFVVGCLLGVTGWLIAYVVEPSPPAGTLIGKDSGYTMQYLDCYKRAAKEKQSKAALTGCAISTGVSLALYMVLIAGMSTVD